MIHYDKPISIAATELPSHWRKFTHLAQDVAACYSIGRDKDGYAVEVLFAWTDPVSQLDDEITVPLELIKEIVCMAARK